MARGYSLLIPNKRLLILHIVRSHLSQIDVILLDLCHLRQEVRLCAAVLLFQSLFQLLILL